MDGLRHDLVQALRRLGRRPRFCGMVLGTLALGIGAASAIFSVADAVVLRPLPYARPDRLVLLWQSDRLRGQSFVEMSYPAFRDWREHNPAFSDLAAMPSTNQSWTLTGRGEPVSVAGRLVSWNFFAVMGVAPALGRALVAEDDRRGAAAVAVLSDRLWRRGLGADPKLVGGAIVLDGRPFCVVGVMPPGFSYPTGADLWTPVVPAVGEVTENRGVRWMIAVGRLRPRVSLTQARRDMSGLVERHAREHDRVQGLSAVLTPLADEVLGAARPTLLALLGAVGVVLLIACGNVAGLQLVQAGERETELAVRLALGATAGRIARGLLVESALLALGGGVLGGLAAWLSLPLLVALSPRDVPRLAEASLDWRACAFALTAVVLTALLTGIAPALRMYRRSLRDSLHRLTPTIADGRSRVRALLVVSQAALALMLLVGAGLLARSYVELRRVPLGFDAERLLSVDAGLTEGRDDLDHERLHLDELIARVQALPAVEAAAAVTLRPLWGTVGMDWSFVVEGQSSAEATRNPLLNFETVTPGYFRTLGIPLKRGRAFDERDRAGRPGVVIVNESFARRYWPAQDAIGRRIRIALPPTEYDGAWLTVIGVVGDARYRELAQSRLDLYMSHLQSNHRLQHLLVRTGADPASLAGAVRSVVRTLRPDRPTPGVVTMAEAVSQRLAVPRFVARVFAAFAAAAILLCVLGLYGVVASSVLRRTREIGIRMSLGAGPADVGRLVFFEGLRLAGAGVLLGLAAAVLTTRLLSSLLFGVRPLDPPTLSAAAAVLLAGAVLGCVLPARRALRIAPAAALRQE